MRKKPAIIAALAAVMFGLSCSGDKPSVSTFTDKRDGQVYKIVKIGRQYWFAENLNYAAKGSVCYEDSPDSCAKYGRLYDGYTAKKACPAGFHLPRAAEWGILVENVGGQSIAAKKLKSTSGWNDKGDDREERSGNGTDEYGFSALPGGFRYGGGGFDFTGAGGSWWSATASGSYAWYINIDNEDDGVGGMSINKAFSFSVRCVLDREGEQ